MGRYVYYCEVNCDSREFRTGVYKVVANRELNCGWFPKLNMTIQFSDRVWKQGPKGGVKIIKDRDWQAPAGYITTDEMWMKKFAWVKLKAKTL